MKCRLLLGATLAASFGAFSSSTLVAQYTWIGGTGAWSDPARWIGGQVPPDWAPVRIDGGDTAVASRVTRADTDSFHNSITIDAGDTLATPYLTASGDLVVNGVLELTARDVVIYPGALGAGLYLSGTGEIRTTAPGSPGIVLMRARAVIPAGLTVRGGLAASYFTNAGTLLVDGAERAIRIGWNVTTPDRNHNYGVIRATGGADLSLDAMTNHPGASIVIEGGGTLQLGRGYPNEQYAFVNNGAVHVTDSTAVVDATPAYEPPPVLPHFHLTRATVRNPSSSVLGLASLTGTTSMTGDAASQPGSRFSMGVATPDDGDLLSVAGVLDLSAADDRLDLSLLPGAALNTPYVIATAASVLGTFDHVTPGFTVAYTPTSVIVTAVPEPSTAAAILLLPPLVRRRRQMSLVSFSTA